ELQSPGADLRRAQRGGPDDQVDRAPTLAGPGAHAVDLVRTAFRPGRDRPRGVVGHGPPRRIPQQRGGRRLAAWRTRCREPLRIASFGLRDARIIGAIDPGAAVRLTSLTPN